MVLTDKQEATLRRISDFGTLSLDKFAKPELEDIEFFAQKGWIKINTSQVEHDLGFLYVSTEPVSVTILPEGKSQLATITKDRFRFALKLKLDVLAVAISIASLLVSFFYRT